jgi:hypothetical protein
MPVHACRLGVSAQRKPDLAELTQGNSYKAAIDFTRPAGKTGGFVPASVSVSRRSKSDSGGFCLDQRLASRSWHGSCFTWFSTGSAMLILTVR